MASSRWRAFTRGASEAVVAPAARDQVAHLVAHADFFGPGLNDVVEWSLLSGVHAELAAVAMPERGVIQIVHRSLENDEVAARIDVAVRAQGDLREIVNVHELA